MEQRIPARSRAEGLVGMVFGLASFGADHWNLPTWVFVSSLSVAGLLLLVAICSLPSMSWRFARRRPCLQTTAMITGPPNFVVEIHEADDMLRYQLATRDSVEEWIDRVFEKLLPWNPAAAVQFRSFWLPETSDSYARRNHWYNNSPEGQALNLKHVLEAFGDSEPPKQTFDPAMETLKEHLDRLVEVIAPH